MVLAAQAQLVRREFWCCKHNHGRAALEIPWKITLFGQLEIALCDQSTSNFRTKKAEGLVSFLAYHAGVTFSREALAEMFWPEDEPELARNSLRVALSSLRRQLEPSPVKSGTLFSVTRTHVCLNKEAANIDVARFQQAIRTASHSGRDEKISALQEALAVYSGQLLPEQHEDWVVAAREFTARQHTRAVVELCGIMARDGDYAGAALSAVQAATHAPLNEEIAHEYIHLLVQGGWYATAVAAFAQFDALLRENLGIPAPDKTRQLIAGISQAQCGRDGGVFPRALPTGTVGHHAAEPRADAPRPAH